MTWAQRVRNKQPEIISGLISAAAGFAMASYLQHGAIQAQKEAYENERFDTYIGRVETSSAEFYKAWQACKSGVELASNSARSESLRKCIQEVDSKVPAIELLAGESAGDATRAAIFPLRSLGQYSQESWTFAGRKEMRAFRLMVTCSLQSTGKDAVAACFRPSATPNATGSTSTGTTAQTSTANNTAPETAEPSILSKLTVARTLPMKTSARNNAIAIDFDISGSSESRV